MQVTRFPDRADGLADRMSGFLAHLRMNGIIAGPRETQDALAALSEIDATDWTAARSALCCLLAGDAEGWRRFDELFDAYWFNAGKTRDTTAPSAHLRVQSTRPSLWQPHFDPGGAGTEDSDEAGADPGEDEAEGTDGRLIATRSRNLTKRDLRELMDDATLRAAEDAARKLARAIRDRRSRRRKQALRGSALDLRRIQRASLARGGEPVDLFRKRRPPRPMQIVALCDVSGSMTLYSRIFLAFLRGLSQADARTEAFLFHTRLLRVTEALRDTDTLRAAARLSLMAEGFGGGTDISRSLSDFLDGYGRQLNSRSVVIIVSDGYCSSDPDALAIALAKIQRRARRVIWLNPLAGWNDYAPVARAMTAALPHIDALLPANTIDALGALEPHFAKL